MKNNKEILDTITPEQWMAIAKFAAERASGKEKTVQNEPEQSFEYKVTTMLQSIGVPANLKGYPYLREAVILVYNNRDYIEAVTKYLYPEIAKKFGTTWSRVERAMRHSIEVAIDRGNPEYYRKIFTMSPVKGKPTNSEAIAEMVEYLKNN